MGTSRNDPAIAAIVGSRIAAHRARRRLSVRTLGKLAGVSGNAIWSYEKGHFAPSWKTVYALAAVFGIKASDLMPKAGELE